MKLAVVLRQLVTVDAETSPPARRKRPPLGGARDFAPCGGGKHDRPFDNAFTSPSHAPRRRRTSAAQTKPCVCTVLNCFGSGAAAAPPRLEASGACREDAELRAAQMPAACRGRGGRRRDPGTLRARHRDASAGAHRQPLPRLSSCHPRRRDVDRLAAFHHARRRCDDRRAQHRGGTSEHTADHRPPLRARRGIGADEGHPSL
jgi:hypothetical protein